MSVSGGVTTGVQQAERNQEATIWIGGLEPSVTEELLYELFLQCGPVVSVHIPKDKVTAQLSNFGHATLTHMHTHTHTHAHTHTHVALHIHSSHAHAPSLH